MGYIQETVKRGNRQVVVNEFDGMFHCRLWIRGNRTMVYTKAATLKGAKGWAKKVVAKYA